MMEASSKDLLVRFAGSASLSERQPAPSPEAAAVELSLGLSLGGSSFGSENREKTKLIRSSSISSFPFFASEILPSSASPAAAAAAEPLARTWSLPVAGVEEDYRKRKELQSMKRMEAKRKRSEKRNSVARTASNATAEDFGGCPWPPGSRRTASAAARGSSSGSSGGSGDALPMKGLDIPKLSSSSPEAKSPPSSLLPPPARRLRSEQRMERRGSWSGEMERSMMEEMPCVSTRGDGPDGRRVEGFLYKYRKGEEVRIVCVCHGSFLTPAEFVRHAGGANVDHPLKHILVDHHQHRHRTTPSALV